jgi:hypothetical protein
MAMVVRFYKTSWFAKAAKKARISDVELREAILQVLQGQADDLGGGVFKKRLNKNEHRAIVISKSKGFWIYEFIFAKKDRGNIEIAELKAFRALAKTYNALNEQQIAKLLHNRDWIEILPELLQ